MLKKIRSTFLISTSALLLVAAGCKKGTFDINANNPNQPSTVSPNLILSGALKSAADLSVGNPGGGSQSGNDLFNLYMGYWSVSGDYIPSSALLTYNLTTDFGSSIWDNSYPTLENLLQIDKYYASTPVAGANYLGISKIMKVFLYQRLVDIYNNVPYSAALNGGANNFPAYDNATAIYPSLVNQLDSAVTMIKAATAAADNPGGYDVMYGGSMTKWVTFANTLKLRILMNLTQSSGGPAYIQSKLTGLTTASFIGTGADATVNPGYNNGAGNQQNPLWQEIGYTTTLSDAGNKPYFRACSYAVNFYKATSDPRISLIYTVNSNGVVQGRAFGSTAGGTEHNTTISGIGGNPTGATQTSGLLKSASQGAVILSSTESLFLQAEAVQRGYLTGSAATLYQSAVSESFRYLGVASYAAAATTYTAQPGDNTNFAGSSNPIKSIIIQKWAALNTIDPLESWNDWRRLGIPSDLPVSVYPGTTAAHVPYRLLYPTSEYNYNTNNVNAQGSINAITSKIFWMP